MRHVLPLTSLLLASLLPTVASAQAAADAPPEGAPAAKELLDRMDANLTFETRTARATMTVEGRRTRTYEMVTYARGEEDSAVEYLAPAREKGTRMLKLGDELWLYLPAVDRVQKLSGHMLRQGMMGSDISYEDLMTSRDLRRRYDARVTGEDAVDGRPCWILEMTARDDSVTYPRRVSCVDKETFIPLRQRLHAVSGKLLKTWTMSDVQAFEGGRLFPTRMTIRDHLTADSATHVVFEDLKFGVDLEAEVFARRWLERR